MSHNRPASHFPIDLELQDFLLDRQARNLSPNTLRWYRYGLDIWRAFAQTENISTTDSVTPAHIRRYLVHLTDKGHTPGGVVTLYTALRAYLHWYSEEYTPANWNPCLLYTSPSPRDRTRSRMPSSA